MRPHLAASGMTRSILSKLRVRTLWRDVCALRYRSDLNRLARLCETDKWGSHFYTQHYMRYFAPFRKQRLNLLEIGVGGYQFGEGGNSLRMWRFYFPKARIVGIDLYDKTYLSHKRVDVFQCDQTDDEKLKRICRGYGGFDIIIDDGSHVNKHVIQTFRSLFPFLRSSGYYCIEDLQTAYWPHWGATKGQASMDFLRSLIDGLNYAEDPEQEEPSYYALNITEIAFFHNLCIVRKGLNNEPSNARQPTFIGDQRHRR